MDKSLTTIQHVINMLPEQAKRSVLYSLVGSLNASVIGTASALAARLERDAENKHYDVRALEPREVINFMKEMDERQDALLEVRRTMRVAQALRDQLVILTENDEDGSLSSTLEFMTSGKIKGLAADNIKTVLEAAGIKDIDPAYFQQMHRMNAEQRAERLSKQRGAIEWLITHVFEGRGWDELVNSEFGGTIETIDDPADQAEDLSAESYERLQDKLVGALNRARDTTVLGVLSKDRRYSLGDLPLIAAAIAAV